jgi:hypothetical protein
MEKEKTCDCWTPINITVLVLYFGIETRFIERRVHSSPDDKKTSARTASQMNTSAPLTAKEGLSGIIRLEHVGCTPAPFSLPFSPDRHARASFQQQQQ